jgi:hypothetical protein
MIFIDNKMEIFNKGNLIWIVLVIGLVTLYLFNEQRKKHQESGYLFLDGSYFINSPYVDSYPQY